ncbi:long-chain fatty acid--CoA ligase [Thermoleophilia bacterium SCSIO 60948]|nr:long-chain fatty acid--CoA ligase [Thermoleophilia bacterium SCSIO 60948]
MEMATAAERETEPQTASRTIADLLPVAVESFGSNSAVRYKTDAGQWVSETYDAFGEQVRDLALGLVDLGVQRGEKLAILANTRREWTLVDFAALSIGATVVPIYQTNSAEECQYVLDNSDSRYVVVENDEQLEKIRQIREQCPKLEHVIRMTGSSDDAVSIADLAERGRSHQPDEWRARYEAVTSEDICTIIYTSGTTGPPKGCVISHGNYRSMTDMALAVNVIRPDDVTFLYLPLAHSFALLTQFVSFSCGAELAYWEGDPTKLVDNLSEVNPTYFPSVPRVFEKIHTTATGSAERAGGVKKALFDWAIGVGRKTRAVERRGGSPNPILGIQHKLADALVLSKIRSVFGNRIKQGLSGAAPINPEILEFFDAAGVLIVEGWGMTETSTASAVSLPDAFKWGTVGRPFPGCQIKIAEDGEILVKGPNIFQGYYKNEEATRETINPEGWLHTGDIGELDPDGYLKITGRKKDIIITAGGKNITPANLEAEIKAHPLVSQCVVLGDRRPYLVALVTLDPDEAKTFASEHDLPADIAELRSRDEVRASIEAHIDQINQKFARVEQVKRFEILPRDLSQADGELTPTLKVKRNVVAEKFSSEVEQIYSRK